MNIMAHKLSTGEEVLGETEIDDLSDEIKITNPVGIAIVRGNDGKPNVGFSPFPLHAEQKPNSTIVFHRKNVVYSYIPADDFVQNYNQIFSSGIIVPPKKNLILG